MRTTTTRAAELRATFKRLGFSSQEVSVRAEYFSLGSAISVEVKTPTLPFWKAKQLAEEYEDVRRDSFGEILGGGNTYVSVRHSLEVVKILGRRHADALLAAANRLPPGDTSRLEPIHGSNKVCIGREHAFAYRLWGERAGIQLSPLTPENAEYSAYYVALYDPDQCKPDGDPASAHG